MYIQLVSTEDIEALKALLQLETGLPAQIEGMGISRELLVAGVQPPD
jgi:hypothetical protein